MGRMLSKLNGLLDLEMSTVRATFYGGREICGKGYAATQRRNQTPSCFVIDIGHHHRLLPVRRAALAWKVIGNGPSSRLSDVTDQEELSAVAAPPLSIKGLLAPDPPGYAATQRRNQTPSCFVIDIGHHHRLLPVRRAALAWKVIGNGPSSRLSDVTDQEELSAVAAPPLSIKGLLTPDSPGYAATQRRNQTPSCFVIDIGHHHRLLPVRRAALAWKVIGNGPSSRLSDVTDQEELSAVAAPPLSIKGLLTPDPPGYAATQRRNQTPSCFVVGPRSSSCIAEALSPARGGRATHRNTRYALDQKAATG
ncbi:uncharacterized protein LOC142791311 [Rhipicephalus microplus]|uniref:uncharacterized protein LOC142791311 n=1 Tax=Rhipicephalus microplus TaxID=6941 RepID=UPI003F6C22D2